MADIERLWTLDDIAAYYCRSRETVYRVIRSEGFPPPATGSSGRRWVAEQVRAFAERGEPEARPVYRTRKVARPAPEAKVQPVPRTDFDIMARRKWD